MANGDTAAALGWTTFTNAQNVSQGYDNDNYVLDRVADARVDLRDKVLPAINQPVFLARGVSSTSVAQGEWKNLTSWVTPRLNDGFTKWTGGALTIAKDGVYRVSTHAQFGFDTNENTDMTYIGAQLVKNTTSPNTTAGTVLKSVPGRYVAAVDLNGLVPLVAGDVVTLLVRQNNGRSATLPLGSSPFDVTMSLEWVRA